MVQFTDVADLAARAAADVPERLALVEAGGRSLNWASLDDQISRVATGLGGLGVVGGHRVLLALGNRIEFVSGYLGVLRAHAVAVPVNPRSSTAELAWMIADSGSRVVVADAETVDAAREAIALVRAVLAGEQAPELEHVDAGLVERAHDPHLVVVDAGAGPGETAWSRLVAAEPVTFPPRPDPERLAALLYTTTPVGRPQAAMLTHRALLANVAQVARVQPSMMNGDDVVLAVLPLFHVYGLNAVLGSALWHRAKVVLVERFHPEVTLDVIDDEAVSVLPVAPPVFTHWLGHPELLERLGPVRLVLSGSETLDPGVAARFTDETGLVIHQGYGLTEAAPVVTTTLHSVDPRPGSFGLPLPGVEVQVVDDLTGQAEGEDPGHLRIRGENLFSGYWPYGAGGPDADGWWETGDVGWFDEHGDLHLVDRVRDVVVVSGFTVYPSEVEDVVGDVEGVAEAVVVGADDPDTGQQVVAYVVLAEGADPVRVREGVRSAAERGLARFKRPTRVELVEATPATTAGRGGARGRLRGLERRRALGLVE